MSDDLPLSDHDVFETMRPDRNVVITGLDAAAAPETKRERDEAVALLRRLRGLDVARGYWPSTWGELDELLDRIDKETP